MLMKSIVGFFFYVILGFTLLLLLTLLIISFFNPVLASMQDFFKISFPIYTSIAISLISSTYRHFFRTPWLTLDLKDSRHYLVDEFDLEDNEQTSGVSIQLGENVKAKAKFIRINLKNKGKETAKNCMIKMHIYFTNHELVHEPSNLYPSGFHHYKKDRKSPPFIDIAAGDSQIFDICSTTNIYLQRNVIRFEDYFNYSRKEVKNNPFILNGIKEVYIKLFVYSDNNNAIEEQYKIFKNQAIEADEWRQIDIEAFKWEKQKDKTREISQSPELKEDIKLTVVDKDKFQNQENQINKESHESYNNTNKYDEYLNGDHSTGL